MKWVAFPPLSCIPVGGVGACFIFQAENKVWPCPCGSCDKHFLGTYYVPGFTLRVYACSDVSLLPSWHSGSCRNEGDELTVTMTLQWDNWCDSERQWDQIKESLNARKASWRRPYDLGEVYRMRMK